MINADFHTASCPIHDLLKMDAELAHNDRAQAVPESANRRDAQRSTVAVRRPERLHEVLCAGLLTNVVDPSIVIARTSIGGQFLEIENPA